MSDPYNHNGPMAGMLQQKLLLAAMEKAWLSCIQSTPQPTFLLVNAAWIAAVDAFMYELQVPGRVFYPYEREACL